MREILFRGKRTDNGEWVQGLPSGSISAIEFYDGLTDCETAEVISETVGQYTGLTDKNGKRVFEGDILLSTTNSKIWFVDYKSTAFCANQLNANYSCVLDELMSGSDVKVIGNIHDNPKLLKNQ